MKSIAIIGAGAAGLMTAATILEEMDKKGTTDFHIRLFEKNTVPGKKVIISGGGRCNVTTSIEEKKILATKYTRGWDFIKKAMGKFSPKKCYDWFESHGVPLKIQEDQRVFPLSDDGHDIVGVFEGIFAKNRDKISLHYGEGVDSVTYFSSGDTRDLAQSINNPEQDFSLCPKGQEHFHISTPKGSYQTDVLVITTGGNAYSHTGSTGDGYAFARAFEHSVTKLGPSLSSFLTKETWLHALSGLAFENAGVSVSCHSEGRSIHVSEVPDPSYRQDDEKSHLSVTGPLLLTHFGISGPLAFMVSSHLAWEQIGKGHKKILYLKPLANLSENEWNEYLKKSFIEHPKKYIISILSERVPRRFAEAFTKEYFSHIEETFVGSISRVDREKISKLLGAGIPITLLERRPGDEFVTAGGVSTDEIDPETMESKIHKNLYFAGEVLNVDGYTGGFSLQICWASGYTAGKSIAQSF